MSYIFHIFKGRIGRGLLEGKKENNLEKSLLLFCNWKPLFTGYWMCKRQTCTVTEKQPRKEKGHRVVHTGCSGLHSGWTEPLAEAAGALNRKRNGFNLPQISVHLILKGKGWVRVAVNISPPWPQHELLGFSTCHVFTRLQPFPKGPGRKPQQWN